MTARTSKWSDSAASERLDSAESDDMRRSRLRFGERTMRGMSRGLVVAVLSLGLMAVGCGRVPSGQKTSAQPSPGGSPSVSCVTPKLTNPGRTFTITEKDSGRVFCVVSGTGIYVFLHGTRANPWGPITPSSPGLRRRASGVMTLPVGVTGGYFQAASLGTVKLTSVRRACPSPSGSPATPGSVAPVCGAERLFAVTFVVRGKM